VEKMIENSEHFRAVILNEILLRLDNERLTDNWVDRGPSFGSELDQRTAFHLSQLQYFLESYKDLFSTFLLLGDIQSKKLFMSIILYRLIGHSKVRIQEHETAKTLSQRTSVLDSEISKTPSKFNLRVSDDNFLVHMEGFKLAGKEILLDAQGPGVFDFCFQKRQYFYSPDETFSTQLGDFVIDAGACLGDTAVAFSIAVGQEGKVFAFDPLSMHCAVAEFNATQNGLDNVSLYQQGLGETGNGIPVIKNATDKVLPGFNPERANNKISITSIDEFVESHQIEKMDFIKMDIEGWELRALKGARSTIDKFGPKLAICLYHKFSDFVEIPQWLSANFPDYEFRLGHYTLFEDETILYAKKR
jgi:FkbM family methyltransferase